MYVYIQCIASVCTMYVCMYIYIYEYMMHLSSELPIQTWKQMRYASTPQQKQTFGQNEDQIDRMQVTTHTTELSLGYEHVNLISILGHT